MTTTPLSPAELRGRTPEQIGEAIADEFADKAPNDPSEASEHELLSAAIAAAIRKDRELLSAPAAPRERELSAALTQSEEENRTLREIIYRDRENEDLRAALTQSKEERKRAWRDALEEAAQCAERFMRPYIAKAIRALAPSTSGGK